MGADVSGLGGDCVFLLVFSDIRVNTLMPRILIDTEEWPVYAWTTENADWDRASKVYPVVWVDDATFAHWEVTLGEYLAMQRQLHALAVSHVPAGSWWKARAL